MRPHSERETLLTVLACRLIPVAALATFFPPQISDATVAPMGLILSGAHSQRLITSALSDRGSHGPKRSRLEAQ